MSKIGKSLPSLLKEQVSDLPGNTFSGPNNDYMQRLRADFGSDFSVRRAVKIAIGISVAVLLIAFKGDLLSISNSQACASGCRNRFGFMSRLLMEAS
jgi:hypothetical protein